MITGEQLFGHWRELKGKLQDEWGELTEKELNRVEGNIEQLIGLIQYKSGQARAQIEQALADLAIDPKGATDAGREYAHQTAETAQDFVGEFRDCVRNQYGQVEDVVRRRPAESIAIAFGTGLITGVIIALVSRSK